MISKKDILRKKQEIESRERYEEQQRLREERREAKETLVNTLAEDSLGKGRLSNNDIGNLLFLIDIYKLEVDGLITKNLVKRFYITDRASNQYTLVKQYKSAVNLANRLGLKVEKQYFSSLIYRAQDAEIGRDIASWR